MQHANNQRQNDKLFACGTRVYLSTNNRNEHGQMRSLRYDHGSNTQTLVYACVKCMQCIQCICFYSSANSNLSYLSHLPLALVFEVNRRVFFAAVFLVKATKKKSSPVINNPLLNEEMLNIKIYSVETRNIRRGR